MCTVSIFPKNDTLIVTMNRDEQRTRSEEGHLNISNTHCYPIDPPSQGTWIGINNEGIICALLNRYQNKHDLNTPKSRGTIIPEFLKYSNIEDALKKITNFSFIDFNPFDFLMISLNNLIHVTWDGQQSSVKRQNLKSPFFISSSSVKTDDVLKYRHEVFDNYTKEKTGDAQDILFQLHLQREESKDEYAVFMRRDNTHTKSIVQIVSQQTQTQMCYWPEGSFKEEIVDINNDFSQEQAIYHSISPSTRKLKRQRSAI